jgi:hypothetical protein
MIVTPKVNHLDTLDTMPKKTALTVVLERHNRSAEYYQSLHIDDVSHCKHDI